MDSLLVEDNHENRMKKIKKNINNHLTSCRNQTEPKQQEV